MKFNNMALSIGDLAVIEIRNMYKVISCVRADSPIFVELGQFSDDEYTPTKTDRYYYYDRTSNHMSVALEEGRGTTREEYRIISYKDCSDLQYHFIEDIMKRPELFL